MHAGYGFPRSSLIYETLENTGLKHGHIFLHLIFLYVYLLLRGDMSLVGTRPPTVQEFEQYSLHHRARMTTKPGITGMWQVSGRSEITDFEEVVRLDREYIENWSLGLDIKILLKTVIIALKGRGAA